MRRKPGRPTTSTQTTISSKPSKRKKTKIERICSVLSVLVSYGPWSICLVGMLVSERLASTSISKMETIGSALFVECVASILPVAVESLVNISNCDFGNKEEVIRSCRSKLSIMDRSFTASAAKIDLSAQPALFGTKSNQHKEDRMRAERANTEESPAFGPQKRILKQPMDKFDIYTSNHHPESKSLTNSARILAPREENLHPFDFEPKFTKTVSHDLGLQAHHGSSSQHTRPIEPKQVNSSIPKSFPSNESPSMSKTISNQTQALVPTQVESLSLEEQESRKQGKIPHPPEGVLLHQPTTPLKPKPQLSVATDNLNNSAVRYGRGIVASHINQSTLEPVIDEPAGETLDSPFGGGFRPHKFSFGNARSFGISVIQSGGEKDDGTEALQEEIAAGENKTHDGTKLENDDLPSEDVLPVQQKKEAQQEAVPGFPDQNDPKEEIPAKSLTPRPTETRAALSHSIQKDSSDA